MNRPGAGSGREGGVHTAKAVALIVVLVAIGIAVLARSTTNHSATAAGSTHHAKTAPTSTTVPAPTTTTTVVPPSQVKVQVLNGMLTGALAGQWASKLKTNPGYITEPADNATAKVTASAIYILTPGYQAEANALAATVGLPASAVNTTIPPPASAPIPTSERSTANLVLVIGPDLAATS